MAKKLVKRDERVVFFEKKRKLKHGGFNVGRMRVRVWSETGVFWCAQLFGYNADVVINIRGARSRAAALKQLERRIELLQRALDTFCREAW